MPVGHQQPFTLVTGRWYAMEFIGREHDGTRYSPIRVEGVTAGGRANRGLELRFYHANYPEGVRNKSYLLQMLERRKRYILAHRMPMDDEVVLIEDISWEWLRRHLRIEPVQAEEDIQAWLDRNA
jgi:hypothetical protein